MKTGFCFILIFTVVCLTQLKAATELKVLVSNKAFPSLVSGVMQGVSEPLLLLKANNSPHTYSLRPSDALNLQKADLVFWGGEILEGFLAKPIQSLSTNAKLVSLQETPGLKKWPQRSGKEWKRNESETNLDHAGENDTERPFGADPHIWLDPRNAKIITSKIVEILTAIDPQNAQAYLRNGEKYGLRLELLDRRLKAEMTKVSETPYMFFHDAYQYFEKRYQPNPIASVTVSSGPSTSVGRLIDIRKKIKNKNVLCIFTEPQFSPKLVQTVISGTAVKKGILDPIGTSISPGPEMYFTLLNNISHSISNCFKK